MNITCGGQEHAADTISIFDYYPPLFRCKILLPLIIGSAVLAFCLLVLLACLPCICMRWYISHRKIVLPVVKKALKEIRYGYRCDYDAVICYDFSSDEDKQWVVDHLIPELEGDEQHPGNVSVCYTLTCNVRVRSQLHVHCTCYLSGPANLLCNIKEFGNIDENELQHGAYSRKWKITIFNSYMLFQTKHMQCWIVFPCIISGQLSIRYWNCSKIFQEALEILGTSKMFTL